MAKRCDICGEGPSSWNKRSFSNKASKRWFKPNIIKKRIQIVEGVYTTLKLCSRCYKKLQKEGLI